MVVEGNEEFSISNVIEAGISEVEGREAEVVDKEVNPETIKVEGEAPTTPIEEQGKPRDERGRFKGKEEVLPETTPQEPVTPSPVAVEAPRKWRAEDREVFVRAPREVQEAIQRREQDFETFERITTSRMQRAENVARQFEEVVKPYGYLLNKYECSMLDAVDRLFHWQDRLESNPEATLHDMAASYGFEIQVIGRPQGQIESAEEEKLRYELETLKAQQETQLKELQANQYRTLVNAWKSEVDATGKPLRPYFDDFRPLIREEVATLEAQNPELPPEAILSEAYNTVVKRMEARGFIRREPDINAIQQKTQAARTAASSLKSEPSDSVTPKREAVSVKDAIAKAMAMHG